MRKLILLFFVISLSNSSQLFSQTLLHYWHFNNFNSGYTAATNPVNLTPYRADYTLNDTNKVKVAFTTLPGTSSNYTTYWDQTTGDTSNAKLNTPAGNCLRPRNPTDSMQLLLYIPSTGFQNISVRYAIQKSSAANGAAVNRFAYSLDSGSTWSTTGLSIDSFVINVAWASTPEIFISNPLANNNPKLVFRIIFGGPGNTGTSGNNRMDNISVSGNAIPQNVLLHYWHFNTFNSGFTAATNPNNLVPYRADYTLFDTNAVKVAFRTLPGTSSNFTTYWDGSSVGDTTNARLGTPAGNFLRPRNPSDSMQLLFYIPTTGYYEPTIKYTVQKSSAANGAAVNYFSYSIDSGSTWLNTGMSIDSFVTSASWTTSPVSINITNPLANNNPRLVFRIRFGNIGATGTSGNNRFDNFSVDGLTSPSTGGSTSDVTPPSVSFNPANNTIDIATNIQPTISFNEDVRLIDNSAITNSNVASLVELRLNDSTGTPVAFTATISGRTITIIPSSTLANNQLYYFAIKGGVIEDTSNNALAQRVGARFTTLAPQTIFNPGDIVPVAYRMNASNADDEVALLTLVDILPGTKINLTDAKFTSNVPAQCSGGLAWTAPASGVAAGTVIAIKNDLGTANIGTLTGSNFGLSSGGDQLIVYTGSNNSPTHVTALSSNNWLATNTVCTGSNSMRPTTLMDGLSSIQFSTTKGQVSGNTANAYYTGPQIGTTAQLRTLIMDTINWNGTASGTPAQTWPIWAFPGPPMVISASIVNSTTIRVIFNEDLENASATNTANFIGISGLSSVSRSNNGLVADTLLLTYSSPFASGNSYSLTISGVKDAGGTAMYAPFIYTFTYNTTIGFAGIFASVKEDTGSVTLTLNLMNPSTSSVQLVVKTSSWSTAGSSDFTLSTQTLNFTGASNSVQTITIPITNDAIEEQDEYFILSLENPTGLSIQGNTLYTVFIRDNDKKAPIAQKQIELRYVKSFDPSPITGSTTEIVVYDSASRRMFMTSSIQNRLDIADFTKPDSMVLIKSIDMTPYGKITSVAVKNGLVAVSSPNVNEQLNGSVVFFNTNGDSLKQVTVGALPDMITFSPDGNKVMTANEGQPNDPYTVDPEGSVSIIDMSGGINSLSQANVTTLLFTSFNSQETTLLAAGVRKLKTSSTLSQDFEPEYVTISADSKKAWVTLQENNAIAEIDLNLNSIIAVWALGTKDYNAFGNGFDASDNSGFIHLANYPVKAFYIPDGIANYTIGGTTYLVTANEGDEKEYGGLNERTTVGAANLDPTAFPNAAMLKESHHIGRLRMSNLNGDTDKDGDFDEICVVGSRSFTIWNTTTKSKVYDSGDDFERITSTDPTIAAQFNSDNGGNGIKNRSRAKGPEPEGLTVAEIFGKQFAFVALERVGGVMVYDITNPAAPVFQDYKNNRSLTSFSGDHGPEGIIYISPSQSPNGKGYIAVANEISGTVSIYEVVNNMNAVVQFSTPTATYNEASGTNIISLNLDKAAPLSGTITVRAINGANATASDYTTNPTIVADTLIIPVTAGSTNLQFTFTPTNDLLDENNETITFQIIRASTGIIIGNNKTFAATIVDNDTVRVIRFNTNGITVDENAGTVPVNITITPALNGSGQIVIKATKWFGVTATDFTTSPTLISDSLIINLADGATSANFTASISDDTDQEGNEEVWFTISRVQGNLTSGNPSVFALTIRDNDTPSVGIRSIENSDNQINMFPNPNQIGHVFFSAIVNVKVYDLQGRLLIDEKNTNKIDVQGFAKGIYQVNINNSTTKKLVIE